MAHPEEQAQRAKVPWVGTVSGIFYARHLNVYWTIVRYTEKQTSIPLEAHTPSVYGQHQETCLQDTDLAAN